jgi:ADP-ribose pyrophosphatase YjhB (NUDIX family)
LPGGFVDKKDLETAAIRELVEETSITVSELEQLKALENLFEILEIMSFLLFFWNS